MSINNIGKNEKIYLELLEFPETNYYIKDLKRGRNAYLSVLRRYTEFARMSPKELIEEARNNIRESKNRLLQFGHFLKSEGVSGGTIRQYLGSKLGRFFRYNMNPIIWTKDDWLPFPDQGIKSKELTENGLKIEKLRFFLKKILRRAKNFRDKAIICSIFSSTMDLSDLFKVTKQNWVLNYDKVSNTNIIIYKRSKNNKSKIAFFSSESCSFINDYFKYERKIFENENEPIFLTFRKNKKDDEHQHSLEPATFSHILRNITLELGINGLDPKSIKKLNITLLKKAGIDQDFLKIQMAHPKGFENANDPDFIEDLRKKYLEIEDMVTIGDESNKIAIKINALENQYRELQTEFTEIKSELKEIKATLLILKTYMTRLT